MSNEKNEIEKLIDNMILNGNEFTQKLKAVLPDYVSEPIILFHESHIETLKKIKIFLNN